MFYSDQFRHLQSLLTSHRLHRYYFETLEIFLGDIIFYRSFLLINYWNHILLLLLISQHMPNSIWICWQLFLWTMSPTTETFDDDCFYWRCDSFTHKYNSFLLEANSHWVPSLLMPFVVPVFLTSLFFKLFSFATLFRWWVS